VNRVLAQARIELLQITRDRMALILILALPVVLLIVIGSATTLKVSHLPIVIQDFDGSGTSREFADAFRASNSLHVVSWPTARGLEDAFLLNKARAALVIPTHFERDILRRGGAPVQLLADGSDSNTAALLAGYVTSIVSAYNQSHGRAQRAAAAPVRAETRLWYNPGLDSQKYSGPGAYVLNLSLFAPLLAALAMAKESETKTILQVYVSNISAHEFLLGKVLAFTLVALAESIPMLVTLRVYFGLSFAGDPTPFIVGTVLYAFCIAAFGVMAGAAIPVRALATQVVSIGGFMLTFLLSGLIFPVDNIPWQIRWISDFVWAKHYIAVVRDAFLQGGGWRSTWLEIVIIAFTGLVFYAIAWKTLRPMQLSA
jgi:ABC-2 type transport system permease protein